MFYTARVPTIQQLPANERATLIISDNLRNAVPEYYQQLAAIKIGISYQRCDGNRDLLSFARLHDIQCSLPVRQMPATWIPVINARKQKLSSKIGMTATCMQLNLSSTTHHALSETRVMI